MKLEWVLERIAPVVGFSSWIGAPESVASRGLAQAPSLEVARKRLAEVKKAQDECRSDYAYWGYAGQKAYWKCLVDLLEAAALVGGRQPA